jgi:hypothetical protein
MGSMWKRIIELILLYVGLSDGYREREAFKKKGDEGNKSRKSVLFKNRNGSFSVLPYFYVT